MLLRLGGRRAFPSLALQAAGESQQVHSAIPKLHS
jgi:hypothetical protein